MLHVKELPLQMGRLMSHQLAIHSNTTDYIDRSIHAADIDQFKSNMTATRTILLIILLIKITDDDGNGNTGNNTTITTTYTDTKMMLTTITAITTINALQTDSNLAINWQP